MLYILLFEAKENVSMEQINAERERWEKEGKEELLRKKCTIFNRYEVIGSSPLKVIFLIQTEEPNVLNLLVHFFSDIWRITTYPVIQRAIVEALKEDRTIVGG